MNATANGSRSTSRAVAIWALAAGMLAASWLLFDAGMPSTPPVGGGGIGVSSTMPGDGSVRLAISVKTSEPDDLHITYEDATSEPVPDVVYVDLRLLGSAGLSCEQNREPPCVPNGVLATFPAPADGGPLGGPTGVRTPWVQGNVTSASYLPDNRAAPSETVRIGVIPKNNGTADRPYWTVRFEAHIPTAGPMLIDTGPELVTDLPLLRDLDVNQGFTEPNPESGSFRAEVVVEDPVRYRTAQLTGGPATAYFGGMNTVVANYVEFSPVNAWGRREPTGFQARFDVPQWRARATQYQFAAGVLAGTATALAVWGVEVMVNRDRGFENKRHVPRGASRPASVPRARRLRV